MQPNENSTPTTDSVGNLPVSPAVATGEIGGAVPASQAPNQAKPESVEPQTLTPVSAQQVGQDVNKVASDVKSDVQSEVSEELPELKQEAEQLKQKVDEVVKHTNQGSFGNTASHEISLVKLKAQELSVWVDQLLAKIKK